MSLRHWLAPASLALLGHAGLFAVMGHVRHASAPVASPEAVQPGEIALDVEPASLAGSPQAGAAPDSPAPMPPATRRGSAGPAGIALAMREAREATAPGEASMEPGHGETVQPSPAGSASDEGWSFAATKPVDVTSSKVVAQSARDVVNEGADRAGAGAAVGGLSTGLDERDVDLGLGRGGAVLSALESASQHMDVPVEGAATFDVAIDTSGHVSVALSDVSSEYAAWSRVASAAGAAVDAKRIRIPPGARGWHVVVRIDAKVQYPNGLKPKQLGNHFEATPGEIDKDSIVMKKIPGVTISHVGKVCGVGLSVTILGPSIAGGCDPTNIGMPAGRLVSGHIVSEGRL
jgi:hypothetical protein